MFNQYRPVFYRFRPPGKQSKLTFIPRKGAHTVRRCAHFFYSTNFPTVRHETPSGCREIYRVKLPRCRGPPLLKSNRFLGFQKKRRFCPMRQFYIRVLRVYPAKATHQRSCQNRSGKRVNERNCAKRPNNFFVLLQCAEICALAKKLFLFGSAASGLTVRLPNMDQMTGGGLK